MLGEHHKRRIRVQAWHDMAWRRRRPWKRVQPISTNSSGCATGSVFSRTCQTILKAPCSRRCRVRASKRLPRLDAAAQGVTQIFPRVIQRRQRMGISMRLANLSDTSEISRSRARAAFATLSVIEEGSDHEGDSAESCRLLETPARARRPDKWQTIGKATALPAITPTNPNTT